jgi:hypothetical protein
MHYHAFNRHDNADRDSKADHPATKGNITAHASPLFLWSNFRSPNPIATTTTNGQTIASNKESVAIWKISEDDSVTFMSSVLVSILNLITHETKYVTKAMAQ